MRSSPGTNVSRTEWLNQNAYRAFPFAEDSSALCTDGVYAPDWLVLDAKAILAPDAANRSVPPEQLALASFSIRSAGSGAAFVGLSFRYRKPSSDGYEEESLSVFGTLGAGRMATLRYDDPPKASATFVVGTPVDRSEIDGLAGDHELSEPRPVLPTRIVSYPGGFGMDALIVDRGSAVSGEVHLRDGYNTSLRIYDGRIRLSISGSEGLGYECPDDPGCDSIHYINGQRANSDGSFSIMAGEGTQVSTGTYEGIPAVFVTTTSLVDSYAKPR